MLFIHMETMHAAITHRKQIDILTSKNQVLQIHVCDLLCQNLPLTYTIWQRAVFIIMQWIAPSITN